MQEDETGYHQIYYGSPSISPFYHLLSYITMYIAAAIDKHKYHVHLDKLSLIQPIIFSGKQVEFLNVQEQTPFLGTVAVFFRLPFCHTSTIISSQDNHVCL
jgi:hypothetical protein